MEPRDRLFESQSGLQTLLQLIRGDGEAPACKRDRSATRTGLSQRSITCPQHTFQILTKRSERLRELGCKLPWPSNVWMGVNVEDVRVIHRI